MKSAFTKVVISICGLILTLLICALLSGCTSAMYKDASGNVRHFATFAINAKKLDYQPDRLVIHDLDSATPAREVVRTTGLIEIGKSAVSGVNTATKTAINKIE